MTESKPESERYREERVAEVLGVTRELVREKRAKLLAEGVGYARAGREILITQAGFDALTEAFGLVKKEAPECSQTGTEIGGGKFRYTDSQTAQKWQDFDPENGAPEKNKAPVTPVIERPIAVLIVITVPRNPKMVLAIKKEAQETSDPIRVRVRDNKNFVPRMELKARETASGVFELVGRCPRYRGRF